MKLKKILNPTRVELLNIKLIEWLRDNDKFI